MLSEQSVRADLQKMQGFLNQDPSNVMLVGQVADLHYQLGEFDKAKGLLEACIKSGNKDAGLRFKLSNVAIASGDAPTAIQILRDLQSEGVDNAAVQYNLAYSLMFAGEYDQARAILLPIVAANDPVVPNAAVLLARCYHHLGELAKGIEVDANYCDQNPNDEEALGVLALLSFDAEQEGDAKKYAERALGINSANLEARIALGSLALGEQNTEEAETNFKTALEHHPRSGRAWSGKGLTDMLKTDINTAIESLSKAVRYMPNHIGTWHALAWSQILTNDLKGAKESLNSAMDLDRNFGETHGGLAVIAVLEGDKEAAKGLARKAVLLDQNCFSGRFAQSLLLQDADPEAAKVMIAKIMATPIGGEAGESLQLTLTRYLKTSKVFSNKH